jgi:hypothetical protein
MESQQMMELLLDMKARLDENAKTQRKDTKNMQENIQENLKKTMKAMMTRMEEDSKAWREKMKAEREADREQSKADVEQMQAEMEERRTVTQAKTDKKLKELTEPSQEMMQSAEEHQEVPREEAAVIPVRGRKRRHRGQKEAAGRHGEPKELTRGDCGSQKKLAAACRKASRRATVAWCKRNVFRKSWTHGNCGPRKVAAARKKVTHCAGHRCKGNIPLYTWRIPKGGTFEKRCRKGPQCNTGIKDPTTNSIGGRSSGQLSPWEEEEQPTRSSR